MSTAPDGSPVDVYALLPELGEGDRVAQAVPPGGSILELGCGTGRITRQLVRLGYRVTAVDESAEMLAHVEEVETVCARIERLDLERRFDAVVLASNLITAPAGQRRAFLETCRRHGELVVVEGLALGWQPEDGETQLGDVTSRLIVERFARGVVHGKVVYVGRRPAMGALLHDAGLRRSGGARRCAGRGTPAIRSLARRGRRSLVRLRSRLSEPRTADKL